MENKELNLNNETETTTENVTDSVVSPVNPDDMAVMLIKSAMFMFVAVCAFYGGNLLAKGNPLGWVLIAVVGCFMLRKTLAALFKKNK